MKKDYLQINAILASYDKVEKNLKALLMKVTESLASGARKRILSSINENFVGATV